MPYSEKYVLELEPANLAKKARALPFEAVKVLRLFDGRRELSDVVEESPLDVSKTLAVVKRGAELGLLSLGENKKGNTFKSTRKLSEASRSWLNESPQPTDECELEEELDRALSCLGDTCPSGKETGPTFLEELPDALEQSLQKALDRYLDEAIEEPLGRDHLYGGYLSADDSAPCDDENLGFTQVEEAFFDSFELEEEEDYENLWVLGDEIPEPGRVSDR